MADDWDLQAVVRGCTATAATSTSSCSSAAAHCHVTDQFLCFPDPIEPSFTPNFEDLSDLFKPFLPKFQPLSPLSVLGGLQDLSPPLPPPAAAPPPENRVKQSMKVSASPRTKRRRTQMKRVCQVPAEGLSSDMWSWRKYGQKPIKGSPYPRGYYRCSTSKGCLARKQVERNRSDPGMFIVTYTGDHTHPMPAHRNSLAGLTRNVTPKAPTTGDNPNKSHSSSSPDKMDCYGEDDGFSPSDMAISDDFFEGLEDIAGDCFPGHFSTDLPLTKGLTFGCE